jgi:hypothetical protein
MMITGMGMCETMVRFERQEQCGCVVHEEGWKHVRRMWTDFCARHDREECRGDLDATWTVCRDAIDVHDRLLTQPEVSEVSEAPRLHWMMQ